MSRILIQSHRGAGVLAPENTLEAFELGWSLGTVPEADVRTTSDGVIVAFHDHNFARVVSHVAPELREMGVKSVSFDTLSQMDVGAEHDGLSPHRAISLREVFFVLRQQSQRSIYLDIKDVVLEELANLVIEYEVEKQVIFASTHYNLHRDWKRLVPSSQTLLWMGGEEQHLEKRLQELRATDFADVSQLQIHVRFTLEETATFFRPSEAFLMATGEELRRRGILFQVLPWGARHPMIYRRLLELGVQSFATDYPDVVLEVVKEFEDEWTPN
ncbi:hypothetical protein EON83_09845 [bacterium]|nr:MAG: hypothetical protein EON83_09845 [bacterium]